MLLSRRSNKSLYIPTEAETFRYVFDSIVFLYVLKLVEWFHCAWTFACEQQSFDLFEDRQANSML